MSQQARQGNTPHAVSKHRETTADGRTFDKVKEVGGAAPESKGAAAKAREAVHGQKDVNNPFPARASNNPHTPVVQDCDEPGSYILREPVPHQKGVNLNSEED